MKLTEAQIKHATDTLEVRPVPDSSKMMTDLKQMFGDHTFFLGEDGLQILEPTDTETGAPTAKVVKVASWTNSDHKVLNAHTPQPTDVLIELEAA